jgi:hypothetical protein
MGSDGPIIQRESDPAGIARVPSPLDELVQEEMIKEQIVPVNQRFHLPGIDLCQRVQFTLLCGVARQHVPLIEPQRLVDHTEITRGLVERKYLATVL